MILEWAKVIIGVVIIPILFLIAMLRIGKRVIFWDEGDEY